MRLTHGRYCQRWFVSHRTTTVHVHQRRTQGRRQGVPGLDSQRRGPVHHPQGRLCTSTSGKLQIGAHDVRGQAKSPSPSGTLAQQRLRVPGDSAAVTCSAPYNSIGEVGLGVQTRVNNVRHKHAPQSFRNARSNMVQRRIRGGTMARLIASRGVTAVISISMVRFRSSPPRYGTLRVSRTI